MYVVGGGVGAVSDGGVVGLDVYVDICVWVVADLGARFGNEELDFGIKFGIKFGLKFGLKFWLK